MQQRDLFQQFFHHTATGIAQVSLDGRYMEVNPRLCEMLGRTRESLIGSNVLEITFPEDAEETIHSLAEMASGRLPKFRFEKRYVRPNGEVFWVAISSSVLPDADGKPQSLIATFEDISLRKAAVAQLQERLHRYNSVLSTTQQGFWMVDLDGRILEVNDAYCRLSGYSREELLTMRVSELDALDSSNDVAQRMDLLIRKGDLQFETQHRRKDGATISLQVSASYCAALGNRIFGFFTDLTQREIDAQAIQAAHKEIKQKAAEVETAIANVSEYTLRQIGQELHDDLGQLLSGAAMLADTIAHRAAQASEKVLSITAENLTAILRDAVARTRRISHGLYPAEIEEHGLVPMLQSLANHLEATQAIRARLTQQGEVGELNSGIALHIYRIVQEASSNVVRHSKAKEVAIAVSQRQNRLRISVTDDGIGMVDGTHAASRRGIGLQTMRSRAAVIGASLSIISPKRGGTRVAISLPMAGEPA